MPNFVALINFHQLPAGATGSNGPNAQPGDIITADTSVVAPYLATCFGGTIDYPLRAGCYPQGNDQALQMHDPQNHPYTGNLNVAGLRRSDAAKLLARSLTPSGSPDLKFLTDGPNPVGEYTSAGVLREQRY